MLRHLSNAIYRCCLLGVYNMVYMMIQGGYVFKNTYREYVCIYMCIYIVEEDLLDKGVPTIVGGWAGENLWSLWQWEFYSPCSCLTYRSCPVESHFFPWRVGVYRLSYWKSQRHASSMVWAWAWVSPQGGVPSLTPSPFIMISLVPNSCDRLSILYVAGMI